MSMGFPREEFWSGIYLQIFFFWLPWVYVSACGLSPAAASRGSSLVAVLGLLTEVAFLAVEHWPLACGVQ